MSRMVVVISTTFGHTDIDAICTMAKKVARFYQGSHIGLPRLNMDVMHNDQDLMQVSGNR